jgi:hypothetical protein
LATKDAGAKGSFKLIELKVLITSLVSSLFILWALTRVNLEVTGVQRPTYDIGGNSSSFSACSV